MEHIFHKASGTGECQILLWIGKNHFKITKEITIRSFICILCQKMSLFLFRFRSHLSTWLSYTKLMKSKKELRDLEKQKEKSSAKVGQFLLNLQTLKKQLEQEKSSTSLKTTSNSRRTTPCSHRLESDQDLNFQVGHKVIYPKYSKH